MTPVLLSVVLLHDKSNRHVLLLSNDPETHDIHYLGLSTEQVWHGYSQVFEQFPLVNWNPLKHFVHVIPLLHYEQFDGHGKQV